MYPLCVVDPEEVRVEDSLYDTRNDSNRVRMGLGEVAVDPIGDV